MYTDEPGFLDGPGMTVKLLVYNIELFWIQWMSCCGTVLVEGEGALRFSLTLSPKVLPDCPMYVSGQFMCGHL